MVIMKILGRFFDKKNEYKAPINADEIDWSKIDLEKANFILQEGEKLMDNHSKSYETLDSKNSSLRTFLIASLTALFSVFKFSDIETKKFLIILIVGFCVALAVLTLAYRVVKFPALGTSPEELLKSKYNVGDLSFLICCQLQTYSQRISDAKRITEDKMKFFNASLYIISLSFVVCFLKIIGFL